MESTEWFLPKCFFTGIFFMRREKAKDESNENERYVLSWMTAQKNLVETSGKNWWVRVWSNTYFLTWAIGQKHIEDSKTDVSLPVEGGSRRSGSSSNRCWVQSRTENKSRHWSAVWIFRDFLWLVWTVRWVCLTILCSGMCKARLFR